MHGYDHDYERDAAVEDGEYDIDMYDPEEDAEDDDRTMFADPGGRSSLRAASATNPRNLPCPHCGAENRLTPADQAQGYQCDECADRAEGNYVGGDY